MFTGIIEAVGEIVSIENRAGDKRFTVATGKLDLGDVKLGDSIAVNGVCLTAVELPGNGFVADVSGETILKTGLGLLKKGTRVNLEKALTPTTRLGGHLVSGHVDGVGEVLSRKKDARSEQFWLKAPADLAKYIAKKGSITVDGISLTVNEINGAQFMLNIVPHTISETNIGLWKVGTKINLEVDLIARYLERLLLGDAAAEEGATSENGGEINLSFLAENGFLK